MKVYALVEEIEGPCGHGEPGQPYFALQTDDKGAWYTLGEPYPLFENKEDAEKFGKEKDLWHFKVLEMEIKKG